MVDADLGPAQAAEIFLSLVRAGAIRGSLWLANNVPDVMVKSLLQPLQRTRSASF
jgi:hypothetical protein